MVELRSNAPLGSRSRESLFDDGPNLYGYADNDPVDRLDRTGRYTIVIIVVEEVNGVLWPALNISGMIWSPGRQGTLGGPISASFEDDLGEVDLPACDPANDNTKTCDEHHFHDIVRCFAVPADEAEQCIRIADENLFRCRNGLFPK